jgi:hypothetical protein
MKIKNVFNADLSNSIFCQIEPKEEHSRGEVFYNEYLTFIEEVEINEREKYNHIPKEVYQLHKIDFNQKTNQ